MGYYTEHNLNIYKIDNEEINNSDELRKELEEKINIEIQSDDDLCYAVGSVTEDWVCDACKWYSSTEDMKRFSKKFPDVVFELEEIGESCDDMWKTYFKNGRYQSCKAIITYDEYDPDKLG